MENLDNNNYRQIKFGDLTADPNEVLVGYKSQHVNEPGAIYTDYIPVIGSNDLEFLTEERKEYKKVIKQYNLDHARCPKCGSESHSTTYVGYILHMDRKDEYKDLNRCVCSNCGDVHTTHDRVK